MKPIKDMLTDVPDFSEQYGIYPLRFIQDIKEDIDERVLARTDLLISQDIQDRNMFGYRLSVGYISEKMSSSKDVIVPNLFGLGKCFFPQFVWNNCNGNIADDANGMFPHGDLYINKFLDDGDSIENIIFKIQDPHILSTDIIMNNWNRYIDKIKERELNWDIKIFDYIVGNYRKYQLLYDQGHPTNILMKEIVMRLLEKFSFSGGDNLQAEEMDYHEEFVYPCVTNALNIEWHQDTIRNGNACQKLGRMDFKEYVEEYVWWRRINACLI